MSQSKISRTEQSVSDFAREALIVNLSDPAKTVARLMASNNSSCAVIALNNQPIGIVTEWDLLTRLVMLGKDSSTTPISEVMSVPLWTVLPSTNVSDAISLMRKKGFRRLVVKDPKRIFGVVTLMQLIGNSREAAILLPFLEGEEDACPVCGKLFKSREDVREHMQAEIHS